MENFIYNTPTKVYFGKNQVNNLESILKDLKVSKVLFCYGKTSIEKIGLKDIVKNTLNAAKIDFIELSGIEPNPKLNKVLEGIKLVKKHNIDFILAVGGGSVIDTAKSIAHGALVDFNPWLFNSHERTPVKSLGVGVILTISAAGSCMSNSCVITNEEINVKSGFNSETNRPKFAILDPTYTYTVSSYQTACGIVDIMMHTLERLIASPNVNNYLTDNISYGLLKSVIKAGRIVMKEPNNYDARATLMWASSLSHNGLTGCGRPYTMRVHQIEHALSGEFDYISHGAGLAVLWPAWCKFIVKTEPALLANLGRELFDLQTLNDYNCALECINSFINFFKEIHMPTTLSELNVNSNHLEKTALNFSKNKTRIVKDIIDIDYDRCLEILNIAL